MQPQILFVFSAYVTSSSQLQSLTAVATILSSIIGGLTKLPLVKILDIRGPPQRFTLVIFRLTIGLIMMAVTNNFKTYCATQIFYWVGQNGVDYSLSIFIADTASLRNRILVFAFASSPYVVTTWVGGPAAASFLAGPGWWWGFGVFAIATPVMAMPLLSLLIWNQRNAKTAGSMPTRPPSRRTVLQSLKYHAVGFDIFGLIQTTGGLTLLSLPLALYFGVPLTILSVGLMIYFRQPDVNIGYVAMCQIFIAFARGTLVVCEQTAAMAATTQQYVAVNLAMEGRFSSIGGAISATIATAIWTSIFPEALAKYLPDSAQGDLASIYGDLTVQTTPERDAINRAYGDAQRHMLITTMSVLSVAVVSTAV
jgi:hypothetical protein